MKNKKLEVIVDRKKWNRGSNSGNSSLLDSKGKMCCLGFALKQLCSLPNDVIRGEGTPSELHKDQMLDPTALSNFYKLVRIQERAISHNDQKMYLFDGGVMLSSSKDREDLLIGVFSREKITLKFKN